MHWDIKIARRVLRELENFPTKDAKRLLFVLEEISKNPFKSWAESEGKGKGSTFYIELPI